AAAATALAACGGGGSSSDEPPAEAVGQVINSSLRSEATGGSYAIRVYLPPAHAAGTAPLPTIYVTEGDALYGSSGLAPTRFDTFKQVMQRRGTQAILVGIGGTAQRGTDFLLPGAAVYLNFITKELAPSIERQYRADPKRRALSGLSHGGYFVVAALVIEGMAGALSFSHYLSTEASVGGHGNATSFLAYEKQLDGKPLPATLFLTGATNGNTVLIGNPLYAQMAAQSNPGLTLLKAEYNASHVGADVPAFEDALARFFP
ncbi:enterochelin esterase-like enzyme, partial [Acidovorax sp. CF316]|uniref:alpha/beta hydrolase n=1 Tax=Acidovorax sp. CF316 TaxID=1144317 RepID=UPI00026BD6C3